MIKDSAKFITVTVTDHSKVVQSYILLHCDAQDQSSTYITFSRQMDKVTLGSYRQHQHINNNHRLLGDKMWMKSKVIGNETIMT